MDGYTGRLLRVDLSSGTCSDEPLDAQIAADYLGGSGLGARLLDPLITADTDPLAPDAPLLFITGPFVGTRMPSAGRYSVCGLSPQTGFWGEANSGGFFGPELRFSGYDGVLVTGQAPEPVWLSIVDGKPALQAANGLWGLGSYATQVEARHRLGDAKARVACIGVAGERLARMAAIMNDHGRAAARCGLGAAMGAKRLKALAVRGRARVPVADDLALRAVASEIVQDLDQDLAAMSLRLAGTAGYVDMGLMYGDVPIRCYQQGEWSSAADLSGVVMAETLQNGITACYGCPIACGRETRSPSYGLERVDGPEYETVAALGMLTMVSDLEAVISANHLCNLYGLDTISVGATIALALELAERGLLPTRIGDGIELRYGSAETLHGCIHLIARREGLGDLMAEGSAALADYVGQPHLAVTVHRLEVPMHDPRAFSGMAAVYALSPRGACHMQGDIYGVDTGQAPAPELGIEPGDRFDDSQEKGRLVARHMSWRSLYNALILCQFQNPGVQRVLRALEAVLGESLQPADLLRYGMRIETRKRLINLRRGWTRESERLPSALTRSLPGATEGRVPDLQSLLAGAYAEFGWDLETGAPLPETLRALGV